MTAVQMLNPFAAKQAGEAPDDHVVPAVDEVKIEKVIRRYRAFQSIFYRNENPGSIYDLYIRMWTPPLSPPEINVVLGRLQKEPTVAQCAPAVFVSRLIEMAYSQPANRRFILAPEKSMVSLCDFLFFDGRKYIDQRPQITVNGETGDDCAAHMHSCDIVINGSVGKGCASSVERGSIHVHGDAGDFFAYNAKQSTFTLDGKVGQLAGAKAEECVFRTPNYETYRHLQHWVVKNDGNRVEHI